MTAPVFFAFFRFFFRFAFAFFFRFFAFFSAVAHPVDGACPAGLIKAKEGGWSQGSGIVDSADREHVERLVEFKFWFAFFEVHAVVRGGGFSLDDLATLELAGGKEMFRIGGIELDRVSIARSAFESVVEVIFFCFCRARLWTAIVGEDRVVYGSTLEHVRTGAPKQDVGAGIANEYIRAMGSLKVLDRFDVAVLLAFTFAARIALGYLAAGKSDPYAVFDLREHIVFERRGEGFVFCFFLASRRRMRPRYCHGACV